MLVVLEVAVRDEEQWRNAAGKDHDDTGESTMEDDVVIMGEEFVDRMLGAVVVHACESSQRRFKRRYLW